LPSIPFLGRSHILQHGQLVDVDALLQKRCAYLLISLVSDLHVRIRSDLDLLAAGWDIRSIERVEINEAFAAIAIVVARELGLSEDIVNVQGGAVAHGHPIGATGAVLTTKLIHSMRRDGLTRGLVTLCIGGGQGIALAIEVVH
jgi:Thiolase, C-terminal domain